MAGSIDLWHDRLGHINESYIKKLKQIGLIPNLNNNNVEKV